MQAVPQLWRALTSTYAKTKIAYPGLRSITLAQWAHESNWGSSALALLHYNFAGINYRRRMWRHARPVFYESSDGLGRYCHFRDIRAFIVGYWFFVSHRRYAGWQAYADRPADFVKFIAERGYAADRDYVEKVLARHDRVIADLNGLTEEAV